MKNHVFYQSCLEEKNNMNQNKFRNTGLCILALGFSLIFIANFQKQADAVTQGELIVKEKTINRTFNEENPNGTVDLKKIVEEELSTPIECSEDLVYCQIQNVSFEVKLKKEWLKINITELNNYDFANTVSKITHPVDQLSKGETVILQEALARRGLLLNLDGSTVYDRGFFGSLTRMGILRLAHIKKLNPEDADYNKKISDEVNKLLDNMSKDDNYVNNKPLPRREEMEPKDGDQLFADWKKQKYVSELAKGGKKVDPGNIPLGDKIEVNINGYVEVQRVTD